MPVLTKPVQFTRASAAATSKGHAKHACENAAFGMTSGRLSRLSFWLPAAEGLEDEEPRLT